jgi:hypothetical protein
MQLNLTGFLEKDTAAFVTDLWRLLLDAQQHNGIPSVMMDEIKEELRKRKVSLALFSISVLNSSIFIILEKSFILLHNE